ncbi:MAG TPA: nuclease-related domain-containing protein [Kiritimatiellia bacterium]|nr:nuclease-related domain-containing protein [Kiritimatiellia bacterium]HRZ11918.1 nuclease-related domain-containing protein [Kiritimatiellia bacterium]HSA17276.1 nuclease-related domain-containing protein [Kiritimatiellia bacterium]
MARILTDEFIERRHRFPQRRFQPVHALLAVEVLVALNLFVAGILLFGSQGPGLLAIGALAGFACVGHAVWIQKRENERRAIDARWHEGVGLTERLKAALGEDCYILEDVGMPGGWRRVPVRLLAITPRGLFVIEVRFWRGLVEGAGQDAWWTLRPAPGSKPFRVPNPLVELRRQVEAVDRHFQRGGVEWPDIQPVLVMDAPGTEWRIEEASTPILDPEAAARHVATWSAGRAYSIRKIDQATGRLREAL